MFLILKDKPASVGPGTAVAESVSERASEMHLEEDG